MAACLARSEQMSLGSNPVSIVIIDDNPRSLEYLSTALAKDGVEILTASNAKEGLDLVYAHRPQIVLSDVVMPGMSGLDVLEYTKKFDPATAVVLMSACNQSDVTEAMQKGAAEYLNKPIPLSLLRECIARLIRPILPPCC